MWRRSRRVLAAPRILGNHTLCRWTVQNETVVGAPTGRLRSHPTHDQRGKAPGRPACGLLHDRECRRVQQDGVHTEQDGQPSAICECVLLGDMVVGGSWSRIALQRSTARVTTCTARATRSLTSAVKGKSYGGF